MAFSIVIPSRNVDNLAACIKALREAGETARVIVVWDGAEEIGAVSVTAALKVLEMQEIQLTIGQKPFCFARNVNLGIIAAGEDDVVLMNDDVLLETGGGLTNMWDWWQWGKYGVMSARVRGPANAVHAVRPDDPSAGISEVKGAIPFVCVLIRRYVLDVVGLLDEQFVPGSYEDEDYCRRVTDAGFALGVCNGCVVDHETLPHTFRPAGKPDTYDLPANAKRYAEKWRNR